MPNLNRDVNRKLVGGAITDDANQTVTPFHTDPTNQRLLIDIIAVSDPVSVYVTPSPKDANRMPIYYGVTDDANETLVPLLIDNRNGYLYVDLFVE